MCPRYYHSADACMRTEIALLLSQYSSCYNAHKFTAQTTCYPIQTYRYRQYASIGINTPYELKHFCYNVIVFLIQKKKNYLLIIFIGKSIPVFMLVMSMQCLKTSSSCLCIACAYIIPHVSGKQKQCSAVTAELSVVFEYRYLRPATILYFFFTSRSLNRPQIIVQIT